MNDSARTGQKLQLSVDYRWTSLGLVLIIIVMLFLWKPWSVRATDRTIDVTGAATVSARPDEFVFYPTYEFKNADRSAALTQLTAKDDEITAKLKDLGVDDKYIKTSFDTSARYLPPESTDSDLTYILRFTITATTDQLAQKVQDYLISTTPTGTISPQATFSDQKRKEIENKGRFEASKNARQKAEQSAKNLGFRLAAVKAVNDGAEFGGVYPLIDKGAALDSTATGSSLTIQPGENDLTYTVTVTYYIR